MRLQGLCAELRTQTADRFASRMTYLGMSLFTPKPTPSRPVNPNPNHPNPDLNPGTNPSALTSHLALSGWSASMGTTTMGTAW